MTHVLELNDVERRRFERMRSEPRSAYRRALEAGTGGLPTWAERSSGGRPGVFDASAAVASYLAGGTSLKAVGKRFGVSAEAVRHHVVKAKCTSADTPSKETE